MWHHNVPHLHNTSPAATVGADLLTKSGKAKVEVAICYTRWKGLTNHVGADQPANQSRMGFFRKGGGALKRRKLKPSVSVLAAELDNKRIHTWTLDYLNPFQVQNETRTWIRATCNLISNNRSTDRREWNRKPNLWVHVLGVTEHSDQEWLMLVRFLFLF